MQPINPPWSLSFRFVVLAVFVVAVAGLDQASKIWVHHTLTRPLPPVPDGPDQGVVHHRSVRQVTILSGIFHLRYVENPAAAFGLTRSIPLEWRRPLLFAAGYLAMVVLLIWIARLKERDLFILCGLSLVVAGALGNAIDRHWHGYVIDFIDWRLTRFFPRLPPWPTFNIADSAIVCGAIAILIRSFYPQYPDRPLIEEETDIAPNEEPT